MLTPDEGRLDRRIAQEAASLVATGWRVDILPVVDRALGYDDALPTGARLLADASTRVGPGRSRQVLRLARRIVARAAPPVDRAVEALRYRTSDRALAIARSNLDRAVALGRYDLVVAHDVPTFPLAVDLKRRWSAVLVCDLHEVFAEQDEFFTTRTARDYWRSVERRGLAEANGIVCVNAAVAEYATRTHRPDADCVVVHNSVPYMPRDGLDRSALRSYYPIAAGVRVMLFAGSLRPHKNLETLIAGFGRARLDGWALAILGEGPLHGALAALIRRLGLEGRAFIGQRAPQRDLVRAASGADLGLLPYQPTGLNHQIATPNKLFEYIQARLPIATSPLPMIERILDAEGNGGGVDFASAASTAEGLRRFVAGTLDAISDDALEAAARRYSWETEEVAYLDLVQRAARVRPSVPPDPRPQG